MYTHTQEHDALRAINRGLRPHPPGAVTAPGPPQLFFCKPLKNKRNFVFPIHEHMLSVLPIGWHEYRHLPEPSPREVTYLSNG